MHIFSEDGPGELYDAEAERNSMYCDRCGGYHSGACPPEPGEESEDGNSFDLACPNCGDSSHLDICAYIWVRVTPHGTDIDESENHDHEWDDDSEINCTACGNAGKVHQFRIKEDQEENAS